MALQEVADEGLEEDGVKQGDAQPAFLSGLNVKTAFAATAVAFQGRDGEGLTAVQVMDGLGDGGVYLLQDAEEGGVGQVALGGAQVGVVYGREADDEGV